jgi:hypothetical protein
LRLRYAGVECHDENEIDPRRNRCGKLTLSSAAFAQTAQMTGQIIALTSDKITVQKGKEVWDINLSASTKVSGDKKVGSTVTVTYNAPDAQKKE